MTTRCESMSTLETASAGAPYISDTAKPAPWPVPVPRGGRDSPRGGPGRETSQRRPGPHVVRPETALDKGAIMWTWSDHTPRFVTGATPEKRRVHTLPVQRPRTRTPLGSPPGRKCAAGSHPLPRPPVQRCKKVRGVTTPRASRNRVARDPVLSPARGLARRAVEAQMTDRVAAQLRARAGVTFVPDLLRRWLDLRSDLARETKRKAESLLRNHIEPLWGQVDVEGLTPAALQAAMGSVGKGTASQLHWHVGAAYRLGIRDGLVSVDPTQGVRPPKAQPSTEYLTKDEQVAYWSALAEFVADGRRPEGYRILGLTALTACRPSEIRTLPWSAVDLPGGVLNLPASKTGARVVPVPVLGLAILEAQKERWASVSPLPKHVFPGHQKRNGPVSCLKHTIRNVKKRSGVQKSPHKLRHTWATEALRAGVPIAYIQRQLGHKRIQTTIGTYAHLGDHLAKETAEFVAQVLTGGQVEQGSPLVQHQFGEPAAWLRKAGGQ